MQRLRLTNKITRVEDSVIELNVYEEGAHSRIFYLMFTASIFELSHKSEEFIKTLVNAMKETAKQLQEKISGDSTRYSGDCDKSEFTNTERAVSRMLRNATNPQSTVTKIFKFLNGQLNNICKEKMDDKEDSKDIKSAFINNLTLYIEEFNDGLGIDILMQIMLDSISYETAEEINKQLATAVQNKLNKCFGDLFSDKWKVQESESGAFVSTIVNTPKTWFDTGKTPEFIEFQSSLIAKLKEPNTFRALLRAVNVSLTFRSSPLTETAKEWCKEMLKSDKDEDKVHRTFLEKLFEGSDDVDIDKIGFVRITFNESSKKDGVKLPFIFKNYIGQNSNENKVQAKPRRGIFSASTSFKELYCRRAIVKGADMYCIPDLAANRFIKLNDTMRAQMPGFVQCIFEVTYEYFKNDEGRVANYRELTIARYQLIKLMVHSMFSKNIDISIFKKYITSLYNHDVNDALTKWKGDIGCELEKLDNKEKVRKAVMNIRNIIIDAIDGDAVLGDELEGVDFKYFNSVPIGITPEFMCPFFSIPYIIGVKDKTKKVGADILRHCKQHGIKLISEKDRKDAATVDAVKGEVEDIQLDPKGSKDEMPDQPTNTANLGDE